MLLSEQLNKNQKFNKYIMKKIYIKSLKQKKNNKQ